MSSARRRTHELGTAWGMATKTLAIIGWLILSACGSEATEPLPGSPPDQTKVDVTVSRPAPDGVGFCCAAPAAPSCDCVPRGGYSPTLEGCRGNTVCDLGPPGGLVLDAHGCLVFRGLGSCLNRADAGAADGS